LIGILIAAIIGGIVAAVLLTRHHNRTATTTRFTTTVVASNGSATPAPAKTVTTVVTKAVTPTTTPAVTTTAAAPSSAATPTTAPATTVRKAATPTTTAATATAAPQPKPTPVSVPDVGSSRVQEAVDRLASSGLLVTLAYVPNDLSLGTVVAESPSAGNSAPSGSHVTLNLSEGKNGSPSNAVPSVTGRTIPEALSALNGAGLRLMFVKAPVTDKSEAGKVVAQTPAPGTRIPAHAEVLVYMGAAG
jgi:hypothetical protein